MKKVFFRVLPLAAAVLFATSCSKDENSVNDEPVNVVTKEKTVTVTGTLSKKSNISKLSCADGENLTFDGNETLLFSGDGGKIHGSTTLNTEPGATVDFTVELSYPDDEGYVLNGQTVTATIGTEPTGVTGSYENINAAAKAVYEVSDPVTINASGNDFSFSGNIVMNVNVAFVKNEKSEAIDVSVNDGTPVSLTAGQICIVPAGVKVTADTKSKSVTVAGQIYTIEAAPAVPEGYVDLGVTVGTQHIYFEKSETYATSAWQEGQNDWPTVAEWSALVSQCYCVWSSNPSGMYFFKVKPGSTSNNGEPAKSFGDYSTSSDPYIFLPDTEAGAYWSSESVTDDDFMAHLLLFDSYGVMLDMWTEKRNPLGVVTVRRSGN